MKFEGVVKKIIFYNEENGYTVVLVSVNKKEYDKITKKVDNLEVFSHNITVVSIFTSLPYVDQKYEFCGNFENSKYGLQFKSEKTIKAIAHSEEGIVLYLSSPIFPGIGKKIATKVYKALGNNAIRMIIKDKTVLDSIDIKDKQKDTIYNVLKQNFAKDDTLIELISLGLTLKMASNIVQELGDNALSIVKENPYSLINKIEGIAFIRADEIASKVGIEENSPYRLKALILYILQKIVYGNGDTYINIKDLYLNCIEIVNRKKEILNYDLFDQYLNELNSEKKILIEGENVYDAILAFQETEIARFVCNHLKFEKNNKEKYDLNKIKRILHEIEDQYNIEYSDKQKEAIIKALMENILIITGGPGTGKSTIIKAILEIYRELLPSDKKDCVNDDIKLVAPTGRAAKRLKEICLHDASTIHKLLGYTGAEFTIFDIDAKILIIDEFSMVDVSLCYYLFKAIRDDTKVIIVGDCDQLPAVGAGDVLNDLILSKEISCVRLNKIHRQAQTSTIISLAHDVNQGILPFDICEKKHDRVFISCNDENIINGVIKTIDVYINKQIINKGNSQENFVKQKEILVNDVQILVPMYKGNIGIDAFNYYMQEYFNPKKDKNVKEIEYGGKKFRLYDKVIQLVNRVDKGVMNGDIGYILSIDNTNKKEASLTVRYLLRDVKYEIDELEDISLAYAISIHKAQGSEFKLVIVPFSYKYFVMLKKKLIYTAITRAKEFLIMVGSIDAMKMGITSIEDKRKTKLQDRIKQILKDPNIIVDNNSAFNDIKIDTEMKNVNEEELTPYDFMEK